MSGWFSQKAKEEQATVDKEVYDKALDENMKLKGQVDKLMLNHKQNAAKLQEAEARLKELLAKTEEESIKLGLLSTDTTRKKDKYTELLIGDVREILVLEQELRILEDKNLKLKKKLSKTNQARQAEIKEQTELIKQIEGDYLISSIASDQRAKMSSKEEENEKKKALIKQLKDATNNLSILENFKEAAEKYEYPLKEKAARKPSKEVSRELPTKQKSITESTAKSKERKVEEKTVVSQKSGWDEDIDIE